MVQVRNICVVLCMAALLLIGCEGKAPNPDAPPTKAPSSPAGQTTEPANQTQQPKPLAAEDLAIQGVAPGMTTAEVEAKLGKPAQLDTVQGVGAQVLMYDSLGLHVLADPASGKVTGWEATGKSLRTARGLQVGATRDEVVKAYGSNTTSASTENQLFYAMPDRPKKPIGFELQNGKVSKIVVRWW